MAQVRDPLLDLEKHRQQLEEHVDNLIIALDEWRQWKEEYETLRVDVKALPSTAARVDLTRAREDYDGELVNEIELVDIFGKNDSRKRDQVLSTLTNRLDYVSKNIDTLAKQLDATENKLATARVVSNPDATDEDGPPITEIMEELDDEDNVVSYSLRRPGDSQAELLEALEKAGINKKDIPVGTRTPSAETSNKTSSVAQPTSSQNERRQPPIRKDVENVPKEKAKPKKKSVAFSEDTKSGEDEVQTETARRLEEIMRKAKDQQDMISDPIIPADDSPEDAGLREDMIRYNKATMMYEMAPIVAELQLEEGFASDDGWGTGEDYEEDEDDEDEDQWGRSTSGVVDDDWKLQMLELKERMSKYAFGEDQAPEADDDDETGEGLGRITVRHGETGTPSDGLDKQPTSSLKKDGSSSATDEKKSVRFATDLDIAEAPASTATQVNPEQAKQPEVDPISDVKERAVGTAAAPTQTSRKKPSRFRKNRATEAPAAQAPAIAPQKPVDQSRYAPSGPKGRTLATSVLEHEPSIEAQEPDEFDANLLQQQVAEEYHKMRNKLVHRQGGFLKENENPIQPLDEEEGGPKRMSRFRAARLAGP
ncbi:Uu.00g035490.m01.CDS01 [Anthostomella pinea]|uniref:Uu.00g035490.m01.CDS01 n=1 Tax=Anthostomella pinea TaxID=933095 RepID=A0AAI8VA99_9PEZI|nr:Uu.00g035490.m01.CDS01 [Anthostomella pinea]